jgi:membrane-associated phospholipid phosphatase
MAGWSIARRLFAIDILTMAFVAALGGGTLARSAQIPDWPAVVIGCALIGAAVPLLGWLRAHLDLAAVRALHDWWFAIIVYVIYRLVLIVAGPSHSGRLFDDWLIAADRWLFGADPTIWFMRVSHPIVTEVLQLAYATFYLLPLAVAVELYARGREWPFRQWAFICGCGFFASYAGYLILPAVGPRFTLHALEATARELPGLWLTPFLRAFIDAGGMAPVGAAAGQALRLAPRDAFPSGHALVTLLSIAWAWRCRLRVRWAVTAAGALLIVATVYLRYHYVADVLAGAVLAVLCLAFAPAVHGWLSRHLGTLDADPKPWNSVK